MASAVIVLVASGTPGFAAFEKHLKPLPAVLTSEIERKEMSAQSAILVRIFKQESELEVWKQDRSGKFALLKTYPICRWSGELGPKVRQGDRQAPEGFYTVTPGQMNPKSQYYLSFNVGYPNAFDRAHDRNGSALMVHGDCLSAGCYAMTDEQMAEIFGLAREAFAGGQSSFQVQAFPFRMNALNMARHRNNPNMPFWRNLKQGHDHFEVTRQQPRVDVCEKRYVFNAQAPKSSARLEFNAQETCPAYEVPAAIASAVKEKGRKDEVATLDLIKRGTEAAPTRTGADGGMHPVFVASLKGPSLFDNDGRLRFSWNKAPGTVPRHVNPPKDASPVFAPTMAYAPETTASVRDSVPLPRAAPRKDGGAFEIATFEERFGPFLSASVTAKPAVQTASAASTPGFRLASSDGKAAPQPIVRMLNTRVASAEQGVPSENAREAQDVGQISPGPFSKMSSAVTRLFGGSANAAEPAEPQAPKPRETVTASLPESRTTAAAEPSMSRGSFDSRWSAFR